MNIDFLTAVITFIISSSESAFLLEGHNISTPPSDIKSLEILAPKTNGLLDADFFTVMDSSLLHYVQDYFKIYDNILICSYVFISGPMGVIF